MQPTLAYNMTQLPIEAPVSAFCFDEDGLFVAQSVQTETLISHCKLDQTTHEAIADQEPIHVAQLTHVNSLSFKLIDNVATLLITGQALDTEEDPVQCELRRLQLGDKPSESRLTHLESANVTGTPMKNHLVGANSALSSDKEELVVMTLDDHQGLQCTVYNVARLDKLLANASSPVDAGSLPVIATVYQSFKLNAEKLTPVIAKNINSIGFSNGRALYMTINDETGASIGKGFWQLKKGIERLSTNQPADTRVTGIQLRGTSVYYGLVTGNQQNQIFSVEKTNWA